MTTTAAPAPTEAPARASEAGGRIRTWLGTPTAWYVACGVVGAVPLLGVVIGMAQMHWVPTTDDATIAWRSWLVFSRHPPLVGQATLASQGPAVYDPGPLLYWVIAVPERLWTDLGPLVGVSLLGAASVVAAVVAAGQVGGRVVAAVVAGAALVGVWSASIVLAHISWNPYSAMLPFAGLLLVTWAVSTGRLGWWPVAMFLGSYCLQAHLVYGAASVFLVVAGPVLGYVALRRAGKSWSNIGRRWLVAGLVVGAVVWAAPVWQQVGHRPGNFTALWRSTFASSSKHLGTSSGLRLLGWSVRVPPMWSSATRRDPFHIVPLAAHGSTTELWAAAALLLLGVVALVGFRRGLHDVAGLAVIALLAAIGAVLSIRGMATDKAVTTLGYVNVIFYPVGFIVWFALAWAAWRLFIQPWAGRHATSRAAGDILRQHRGVAAATSIVLLLVASIAATGWISHSAPHANDFQKYAWRQLGSIDKQVLHLAQQGDVPKGRLAFDIGALGAGGFEVTGVGYQLLTHGWTPAVGNLGTTPVDDLRFQEKPTDARLIVTRSGSSAVPRARRLGGLVDPATGRHYDVYYRAGSG